MDTSLCNWEQSWFQAFEIETCDNLSVVHRIKLCFMTCCSSFSAKSMLLCVDKESLLLLTT